MITYILIFAFGIALSAFFSGSETGLYRVPRMRLVLDAMSGKTISKCLLWLANHSPLFVATVLVGNNIANYLSSFAIVMLVPLVISSDHAMVELLSTVAVTPIVFVLGELLPKSMFFNAPYRLLGYGGPLIVVATIVFFPISIVLVALNRILSSFTGGTPLQSRQSMARSELQQLLRHGQNIGLLKESQQRTAQNIWHVGEKPAIAFAVAPDRLARVRQDASPEEAITAARRQGHPLIIVEHPQTGETIGYVRYADLASATKPLTRCVGPCIQVDENANNLEVLIKLYDQNSDVAELVDSQKQAVALVTRRQLQEPLMRH